MILYIFSQITIKTVRAKIMKKLLFNSIILGLLAISTSQIYTAENYVPKDLLKKLLKTSDIQAALAPQKLDFKTLIEFNEYVANETKDLSKKLMTYQEQGKMITKYDQQRLAKLKEIEGSISGKISAIKELLQKIKDSGNIPPKLPQETLNYLREYVDSELATWKNEVVTLQRQRKDYKDAANSVKDLIMIQVNLEFYEE
jgi:RNase adaptor protein for sRNA GlmZ degradation